MKGIPGITLLSDHLANSFSHCVCEWRKCSLHPDLNRFERAKRNISQEFSRRTCGQVNHRLADVWEHLLAIGVFENFIEAIFPTSLQTVSDKCRGPAKEYPAEPFGAVDAPPGLKVRFVEFGINLTASFHKIEGGDGCVSWATCCQFGSSARLAPQSNVL